MKLAQQSLYIAEAQQMAAVVLGARRRILLGDKSTEPRRLAPIPELSSPPPEKKSFAEYPGR